MNSNEQKEKFLQLAELLKNCNKVFCDMLKGGDSKSLLAEILDAESKGDSIQEELDNFYAQQKSIPYLALDRAKLLQRIDDTLDAFAYAARILHIFGDSLPSVTKDEFPKIAEDVMATGNHLSEAIEHIFTDFQASLVHVRNIEELRDITFEKSFELEASFFKSATDNDWKAFRALHEVLSRTMECIRAMKRTSEILSLMVYKYE